MTQNSPIAFADTESGTQLVARLNDVGETIRSTSRGTARPAYAAAGTLWVDSDTPGSGVETLNFFDGTDDIAVAVLDTANNRVEHSDLLVGASLPASPDGTLHVHSASAGAVAAVADYDELVVEGSGNTGITILAGTTGTAGIAFGDSGDADIGTITYDHASDSLRVGVAAGEVARFGGAGHLFLNETADGDVTVGLSINQAANTDKVATFKNSGVAHARTGDLGAETDTFGYLSAQSPTSGGFQIAGLSEGGQGLLFVSLNRGSTVDATKNSGSQGATGLQIRSHDGANAFEDVAANGNLFFVRGRTGSAFRTVFLVDIEGDLHVDGSTSLTAFDGYDDMALIRASTLDRKVRVEAKGAALTHFRPSRFDANAYGRAGLEDAGLIGRVSAADITDAAAASAPEPEPLVNVSQQGRLVEGALWQVHEMLDCIFSVLDDDPDIPLITKAKFRAEFVKCGLPTQILDWSGRL